VSLDAIELRRGDPIFRAKAPLRLSFAGGGTDVPPFPEREGGLVLSATINRHAHSLLQPRLDREMRIQSLDLGLSDSFRVDEPFGYGGKLDLIEAAVRKLADPESPGCNLLLRTSAPPGSGLGSSSALTVALIGVLTEYRRLQLTHYEIADLACRVERVDLGIAGGLQDQYAATFGGFNFIEFSADHVVVNPLRIPPDVVNELEQNLLLCHTGLARATSGIIDDQTRRFERGDEDALAGLRMQRQLAVDMKRALLRGELSTFAELLGVAWDFKKKMSPRISTGPIDELHAAGMRAGAIGGKVTGAGGGGYMLFYCRADRRHRVAEAITERGGSVADFEFTTQGVSTWTGRA
jgi:D-glycero-alpha-D-manno-heptose-7-phosphate kinase